MERESWESFILRSRGNGSILNSKVTEDRYSSSKENESFHFVISQQLIDFKFQSKVTEDRYLNIERLQWCTHGGVEDAILPVAESTARRWTRLIAMKYLYE